MQHPNKRKSHGWHFRLEPCLPDMQLLPELGLPVDSYSTGSRHPCHRHRCIRHCAHTQGKSSILMVPVIKSFAILRGQSIRYSETISCCPLPQTKSFFAGTTFDSRTPRSRRHKLDLIRWSTSDASDLTLLTSSEEVTSTDIDTMGKEKQNAAVDTKIAKALLDFINASWTPYHAVGMLKTVRTIFQHAFLLHVR